MTDQNSEMPWASFCMSTYRRTDFLQEALSVIRKQTFADFEVVISDNDPEASAAAVVAGFRDSRFRYFHNGANLGMVASFNKSIERSRGRYIVMITDDDPVYEDMLQTLYDLHLKYPGHGVYFGGHDTFYLGVQQARMAKARVGTNSALPDMELGEERVYAANDFPAAFLDGPLAGSLLWSTGVVRRDIAVAVGGFPDYGTPHMADNSYLFLSAVREGLVYVNRSLGYRAIHNENFSYREANYESIYKAPEAFFKWTVDRLPADMDTPAIRRQLGDFVGRDLTVYVISIRLMLREQKVESSTFEEFRQRFFRLPLLKKWKRKYFIAAHFPNAFSFLLALRRLLSPSPSNASGK
jgi:glycosyltransferase involved in cell wall biosynthesis